jgi:hypothetical protein
MTQIIKNGSSPYQSEDSAEIIAADQDYVSHIFVSKLHGIYRHAGENMLETAIFSYITILRRKLGWRMVR